MSLIASICPERALIWAIENDDLDMIKDIAKEETVLNYDDHIEAVKLAIDSGLAHLLPVGIIFEECSDELAELVAPYVRSVNFSDQCDDKSIILSEVSFEKQKIYYDAQKNLKCSSVFPF